MVLEHTHVELEKTTFRTDRMENTVGRYMMLKKDDEGVRRGRWREKTKREGLRERGRK